MFSLFFSIDNVHFPTAVGTEGLFIACESWVSYSIAKANTTNALAKREFYFSPKLGEIYNYLFISGLKVFPTQQPSSSTPEPRCSAPAGG